MFHLKSIRFRWFRQHHPDNIHYFMDSHWVQINTVIFQLFNVVVISVCVGACILFVPLSDANLLVSVIDTVVSSRCGFRYWRHGRKLLRCWKRDLEFGDKEVGD